MGAVDCRAVSVFGSSAFKSIFLNGLMKESSPFDTTNWPHGGLNVVVT